MPTNTDLLLDKKSHDLVISKYDLHLVESTDATAQRLKVKLKIFLGEYFLNTLFGLPYYEQVFKKNPDLAAVEAQIKAAIKNTYDVKEILSFSMELDNAARSLYVNFAVRTLSGDTITMNEVLP